MTAKDLFGQPAVGCQCASCSYTATFWDAGFSKWPKGAPAGKSASAAYAAHVAYGKRTEARMTLPSLDPVSSYGVPVGLTRSQVKDKLAAAFATIHSDEQWAAFDAAVAR